MGESNKHSGLTLANKITILRLMGIPVFILMLVYYEMGLREGQATELYRAAALAVFVAVALTDALDGYVARTRGEVTHLGKILDPLADKSLLLSGLILLTRPSMPSIAPHIPVWFALLVISRDVVLILGSVLIHTVVGHIEVTPRIPGKAATFFQMVAVTWVLAGWPVKSFMAVVAAAGIFTFVSWVQYVIDGTRQLEKAPTHHHGPTS